MLKKITVIGHRNQDTDATMAAIALADLLTKTKQGKAEAKIADLPNRETLYVMKTLGIKKPGTFKAGKQEAIFLVDFNEESQSPIPFRDACIEGLVDHHKLNISFSKEYPILFRVEPVGSSSTIVAKMHFDHGVKPEKKIASALTAGIVSDTLKFTSPTTTDEDIKIGKKLAKIAGVNIDRLAAGMFRAKSDLRGMSGKDIITMDYKEFVFGNRKTGIGVLETVNAEAPLKMEKEIRKALDAYKKERNLNLIFFGAVDIIKQITILLLLGKDEEETAKLVFSKDIKAGRMELPGVVSRKKEIVPPFMEKLK